MVALSAGMENDSFEIIGALEFGDAGKPADADRDDDVAWPHRSAAAVSVCEAYGPSPRRTVIFAAQEHGPGPDVEFHAFSVVLEPIGELVLWDVYRPCVGERHVGKMIHADFVMKCQRSIAFAPNVANPLGLVDDERADVELAQSGRGHQARLACTDDNHIGIAISELERRL